MSSSSYSGRRMVSLENPYRTSSRWFPFFIFGFLCFAFCMFYFCIIKPNSFNANEKEILEVPVYLVFTDVFQVSAHQCLLDPAYHKSMPIA